jgi:hypothetical protein
MKKNNIKFNIKNKKPCISARARRTRATNIKACFAIVALVSFYVFIVGIQQGVI